MRYERPDDLRAALALMTQGCFTPLAGGTDLYPATEAARLDSDVLDLSRIAELQGISEDESGWRIGACATWAQLVAHPMPPGFDALKQAAALVGSRQIQNAATLVGNLCNASPAADGAPCLMVLDAQIELAGPQGERRLTLGDFLLGNRRTARTPDEIAVALHIPRRAAQGRSAFEKLGARRQLIISIAMCAARIEVETNRIAAAAIAIGACSAVATRLPEFEAALIGQPAGAPQIDPTLILTRLSPIDDLRASAAYRRDAAVELTRRAIARAVA